MAQVGLADPAGQSPAGHRAGVPRAHLGPASGLPVCNDIGGMTVICPAALHLLE